MSDLTVMISSTQIDLQPERDEVERAIRSLHLQALRAETLGSRSGPSRQVCLDMARDCDLYVLILGERYGWVDAQTDKSVTELEFEQARRSDETKILIYRKSDISPEPRQAEFIGRVEDFDEGYFRRPPFTSLKQLGQWVKEDISNWIAGRIRKPQSRGTARLSHEPPVELSMVGQMRGQWQAQFGSGPWVGVCLALVGADLGLTPYKLGDQAFVRKLGLLGLQSDPPFFDLGSGIHPEAGEDRLRLWQTNGRREPVVEATLYATGVLSCRLALDRREVHGHDFMRNFYADPAAAEDGLFAGLLFARAILSELGIVRGQQFAVGASLGGMHMRNFAPVPTHNEGSVSINMFGEVQDPLPVPQQVELRSWKEITTSPRAVARQWVDLMKRAYSNRR